MELNTNQNTYRLGSEGFRAGQKIAQDLIRAAHLGGGGMPDGVHVMGNFLAGAASILAAVVANQSQLSKRQAEGAEDDELKNSIGDAITPDVSLFAWLLAQSMAPDLGGKTVETSFGPQVVFEALTAFEKMTGRQPDKDLCPPMVSAAREIGASGRDAFNAFIEARKQNPNLPTTLN